MADATSDKTSGDGKQITAADGSLVGSGPSFETKGHVSASVSGLESASAVGSSAKKPSQAILVLGMHRSGTSAIMRLLNLMGVAIGDDMMKASPDNERGYWEHVLINKRNIEIMDAFGQAWSMISAPPAGWTMLPEVQRVKKLLTKELRGEFESAPLWGIKDPRISVLLLLYREVLADLKVTPLCVLTLRNPLEVARSVSKRDGFALSYALMMWLRYTLEAEFHSRGTRRVIVDYNETLGDWEGSIRRIGSALGIGWPVSMETAKRGVDAFLDPQLRHQQATLEALLKHEEVPTIIARAYAAMKNGQRSDDRNFWNEMDAIRAEANDPRPLLASMLRAIEADNKRLRDIFEDDRRKLPEDRVRLIEDLDRATAQSSKLELQLESATRQLSDAQIRLRGAEGELSTYRYLDGEGPRPGAIPGQAEAAGGARKKRVLVISHSHPSIRPGGAENYAWEMYQGLKNDGTYDAYFLAKGGMPMHNVRLAHPGTPIYSAGDDPHAYFIQTETTDIDLLMGISFNKALAADAYQGFLKALKPDVVHFQHTVFLGYEFLRTTRHALGEEAVIAYTLHEYIPICHADGQMVKPRSRELCYGASPHKCHSCFPEVSPQAFFLRKKYAQAHFEAVDMFLCPSRFLLERYADWGIPREKLRHEENGRLPPERVEMEVSARRGARNRFAFFGQVNPYKGIDVLLEGMKVVEREWPATVENHAVAGAAMASARDVKETMPQLKIHGANLDIQRSEFAERVRRLVGETAATVKLVGPYQLKDQGRLMAGADWVIIPSTWWENAPMVIQEAFMHGKPVICSDIGGMAEKIIDGVNGLHFKTGDPNSLAAAIQRAASEPGLWEKLAGGITEQNLMHKHVAELKALYGSLAWRRRERVRAAQASQATVRPADGKSTVAEHASEVTTEISADLSAGISAVVTRDIGRPLGETKAGRVSEATGEMVNELAGAAGGEGQR